MSGPMWSPRHSRTLAPSSRATENREDAGARREPCLVVPSALWLVSIHSPLGLPPPSGIRACPWVSPGLRAGLSFHGAGRVSPAESMSTPRLCPTRERPGSFMRPVQSRPSVIPFIARRGSSTWTGRCRGMCGSGGRQRPRRVYSPQRDERSATPCSCSTSSVILSRVAPID